MPLFHLVPRLARGALDNARRASEDLRRAVSDRRELQPLPEPQDGRLSVLSRGEALDLLASHELGRLCFVARAGVPDVVPVTYAYRDGRVLVRSGPGPKLQAAERGDVVALEVDDVDLAARTGRSVVVSGSARRLTPSEVERLSSLPEPWATGPRRHVLAVEVRRVTGRRLG